jgi:glycosyltransferase involved in cell wall biosynthesis
MNIRSAVLLTGNVLCNNPRVIKEADALAAAGWRVEVLGASYSPALAARDRQLMSTRPWTFTSLVSTTDSRWLALRVRARAARSLATAFHIEHRWQLGYVSDELFAEAARRDADLFVAHSEQALWAAVRLAREGRRVGVDLEDWFSEDLHPEFRAGRPVGLIRRLEQELLANAVHSTCPSDAMSRAISHDYRVRPPTVVYNAFPWADRRSLDGRLEDRSSRASPSIHWYSQTIGPNRGLEEFVQSLVHVRGTAEIHLRGTPVPGFVEQLRISMPEAWRSRLHVHETVGNEALPSRIAEHDIGLASELTYCRNKDLTVSNKILQYMTSGLAVVASDTQGQREIARRSDGAVTLHTPADPALIAAALDSLLLHPERLAYAKAAALRSAETIYAWEQQTPALLASFDAAVSTAAPLAAV